MPTPRDIIVVEPQARVLLTEVASSLGITYSAFIEQATAALRRGDWSPVPQDTH